MVSKIIVRNADEYIAIKRDSVGFIIAHTKYPYHKLESGRSWITLLSPEQAKELKEFIEEQLIRDLKPEEVDNVQV